jgi:hypothetical protein
MFMAMRQVILWSLGTLCPLALVLGWWHSPWWELLLLPPIALATWATIVTPCTWWGPVMCVFPTRKREALVTIDHGPDPDETPLALDLLDQYGAKALFFVSGLKAQRHPTLIKLIIARGHGLGLHGMTDSDELFLRLSPNQWRIELGEALRVIAAILPNYPVQWLRTANGRHGPWLEPALQLHQVRQMGWSAGDGNRRSEDFEKLVIQLRRDINQGAIVRLRHGLCDAHGLPLLPDLLKELLPWLRGQSYRLGEES